MSKRRHDEYTARRELQDNGWRVDKENKTAHNGGNESLRHYEAKARVSWYLIQQGYSVDSEVVGPNDQEADIVAYGNDEPPFVVECETDLDEEKKSEKLDQFYYNTPFAECYLFEVRDMPDTGAEALNWLQDQLGGEL